MAADILHRLPTARSVTIRDGEHWAKAEQDKNAWGPRYELTFGEAIEALEE